MYSNINRYQKNRSRTPNSTSSSASRISKLKAQTRDARPKSANRMSNFSCSDSHNSSNASHFNSSSQNTSNTNSSSSRDQQHHHNQHHYQNSGYSQDGEGKDLPGISGQSRPNSNNNNNNHSPNIPNFNLINDTYNNSASNIGSTNSNLNIFSNGELTPRPVSHNSYSKKEERHYATSLKHIRARDIKHVRLEHEKELNKFYKIDYDNPLGKGSYGTVYTGQELYQKSNILTLGGENLNLKNFHGAAHGNSKTSSPRITPTPKLSSASQKSSMSRGNSYGSNLGDDANFTASSSTSWAIKKITKQKAGSAAVELLYREVSILKRIQHPNIIHLEAVYESPKDMYLVTELCIEGELKSYMKKKTRLEEDEARKIIFQLSDALCYLHSLGVVHRDIKGSKLKVEK